MRGLPPRDLARAPSCGGLGRAGACALLGLLAIAPAEAGAQEIDVVELTVEAVQHGYATGRFTAVQLTSAFLARIDAHEERYNAFISMNPAALALAAELDAEYARSGPRGPLHGVPIVIKDNIDQAGLVTTAGWEGFSARTGGVDLVPDDDAVVVRRLRAAGAIILGKTNLPDFAGNGTRTRSTVAGRTLNPSHLGMTPGGSSGGTATAVNASFAVLGIGTETGGSIQNPASAQGLVSVKPTHGLVPLDGVVPLARDVDVVGPLARTVRDAALALDALAGPSDEDSLTAVAAGHVPEGGYAAALNGSTLAGKRFGLVGPGWRRDHLPLDSATERLYREAVLIAVGLGATVVRDPFRGTGFTRLYARRPPPAGQAERERDLDAYLEGLGSGAAFHSIAEWERLTGRHFLGRDDDSTQQEDPRAGRERAESAQDTLDVGVWRERLLALYREVLTAHDLDGLLFPQAGAPSRALVADPARPDFEPNDWPEIPSNIVNDLGVPVVTLPFAYYADGTPFVLALVGDRWSEAQLLSYAQALEGARRARRAPVLY